LTDSNGDVAAPPLKLKSMPVTRRRRGLGLIAVACVSLACTVLALGPLAVMAYRHFPARVATVDLQSLVEEDQQKSIQALGKVSGGVATADERTAYAHRAIGFAKRLSDAVDALGESCRCVIVNKAAVLGGSAADYTDSIRRRVGTP